MQIVGKTQYIKSNRSRCCITETAAFCTMEELIKIQETNGMQAVSARELHTFLGSKRDFSNWIKNRIDKYGLIEEVDFTLAKIVERGKSGAQTKIEYALTIDCAKELSMVEGNEKGKQARKYFIACEKKLREIQTTNLIETTNDILARLEKLENHSEKSISLTVGELNALLKTVRNASIIQRPEKKKKVDKKPTKKPQKPIFEKAINCVKSNLIIPKGDEGEKINSSGIVDRLIASGIINKADIKTGHNHINSNTIGRALSFLGFQRLKFRPEGSRIPLDGWYVKFK